MKLEVKLKKNILIFLLLSVTFLLNAQVEPDTLWTKTFGGSNDDVAQSVKQTTDGGYIIAGCTDSFGAGVYDFWLVKVDENGNEQWNQTYGGIYDEQANSVHQTNDGGYIVSGYTHSYGAGQQDIYLVKTDENGNELWSQTYGGTENENANSVQQTSDGGYVIASTILPSGSYDADFWLIKTDENGNEQWNQTYGNDDSEGAQSVQQTIDGGYIIVGTTFNIPEGKINYWLVKTDENGSEQWNQTFGINDWDFPSSVQQTIDGGYIIAGYSSFTESNKDFWVVKTDENGIEEWNQNYGTNDSEFAFSIQQTFDEGFIIAGYIYYIDSAESDAYLVKTDVNGNEQWNKTCGNDERQWAKEIKQTNDEGYIITGWSESCSFGDYDFWIFRLGSDTSMIDTNIPSNQNSIENYPNPFNPTTTIKFSIQNNSKVNLTIFNIKGQKVKTLAQNVFSKGIHSIIWNGDDGNGKSVSSGIYYYKLSVNGETEAVKKCLLVK